MRVLLAPDKFRGTLTGLQAARSMAAGVARAVPGAEVDVRPIADGGEGFLDAVATAVGARVREVVVADAAGLPRTARLAVHGTDAYVESADGIGLHHRDPSPHTAVDGDSGAVGELMLAALDAGARRIVVGIGGTSTSDGGTGLLRALGARFRDGQGRELPRGARHLAELASVDLVLDRRLAGCEVVCAHDVDVPLLGPRGAARSFGPQKGADHAAVELLEAGLGRLVEVVRDQHGTDLDAAPGAGAGGGLGAALAGVLGASTRPGADLVLDLIGLDDAVGRADLVLTGEGSFDEQSLQGKGPWAVATRARAAGVAVIVLCGRQSLGDAASRLGLARLVALADVDARPQTGTAAKLSALTAATLTAHLADRTARDREVSAPTNEGCRGAPG